MRIKRRRLVFLIRSLALFGGVFLAVLLVYGYFFTQLFTITTYTITGVDEDTRVILNNQLHLLDTQKLYKVFPVNKIFTYSSSLITTNVQNIVKESASISVRPVGLHTIKIEITLLKPVFRINHTEAITQDGIIFTSKYDLHMLPVIIVASTTTSEVKNNGLTFTKITVAGNSDFANLLPSLSDISTKISSIIFPVTTIMVESTGDIFFISEQGTSKVMILQDSDKKKTWSTLVSAIDTDPLKSKLLYDKKNLEYLDARYGNKVFYRFSDMTFKNSAVTGILDHHASTTTEITASTTLSR